MQKRRFSYSKAYNAFVILLCFLFLNIRAAKASNTDSTKLNLNQISIETSTLASSLPPTDDLISLQIQIDDANNHLDRLNKARAAVGKALDIGHFIQHLDSLAWIEFPVVLADTISNVPVAIVFDDLRLYPDYAQLEVIVMMQLPQRTVRATVGELETNGQEDPNAPPPSEYVELFFGTPDLKFSHDGGIIGESLLGLYSDFPIGTTDPSKFAFILRGWHEYGQGNTAQSLGTYVKINCDGFVEMGVEADVFFSREWIVPVDQNDEALAVGRVEGHIQTVVTDWQNLLVEIDIPNFAPAEYTDISFNLSTAIFDFSDYRNSPNVVFPTAYAEQHLMPGNPNLWRGVYIKNLELSLPRQIKEKDCLVNNDGDNNNPNDGSGMLILDESGTYVYGMDVELGEMTSGPMPSEPPMRRPIFTDTLTSPLWEQPPPDNNCRTKIGVNDLLIDGHGVSGVFYAEEVLTLDKGNMDGWKFSLEDLAVELVCSDVVGFGFGGEISIPVQKKTQSFDYTVFVNIPDKSYNFNIAIGQNYTFPVFKMAEVNILEGSYLNIEVTPDHFEPVAVLYGNAGIKAKTNSESEDGDDSQEPPSALSFQVGKLNFEGLRLATQGTKLSMIPGGNLRLEAGLTLLGYELPISDPTLTAMPDGKMKLNFAVSLNLMNQQDNGFAAGTSIDIMGKFREEDYEHEWSNDGMNINSIYVNINLESLSVEGHAHVFDDHPVYGRGFQGGLIVKIGPTEDGQDPLVEVELNAIFGRTDFKYWYVDGFVELEELSIPLIKEVAEINGFGGGAYYHMKMDGMDLLSGGDGSAGTTTSGVRYVPHLPTTLGLKASIAIRSPGTETLDGLVTLELRFEETGLQEIMLYGKAEIVSPDIDQAVLGGFSDKLNDRISDLQKSRETMKVKDSIAINNPDGSILATFFLRMNFEVGFEFQGTFRAKLDAAEGVVQGEGGIDLLISKPQNRWHLYIGGYSDNSIMANDHEPLPPISVSIDLGEGMTASAYAYFLMGNDIPGPPPLPDDVAAVFGQVNTAINRAALSGQAALGAGFAFGAGVNVHIDVKLYNKRGQEKGYARGDLGAGFDVSLLKYDRATHCSLTGDSPHGHKGWRATGNIWAYVNVEAKYGIFTKSLSLGLLISADLPKPTYLSMIIAFKILKINIEKEVNIGDRCGLPLVN